MQLLSKDVICRALVRLDEKLGLRGIEGEVCLFGGTVMMFAFNARESTKDVDAIFQPTATVRPAIKEIQEEQNLPDDWMNDAAKIFTSPIHKASLEEAKNLPAFRHLKVYWPRPEYLLAMKAMSSRQPSFIAKERGDIDDIKLLVQHLGLKEPKEVFDIVQKYYAAKQIPARTEQVINMVFHHSKLRQRVEKRIAGDDMEAPGQESGTRP